MKKMKLFSLMFLAGTLIFSSCSKDAETAAPTLSVGTTTETFDGTDKNVVFSVNITAEAEVEAFSITEVKTLDGNGASTATYDAEHSDYKGEVSGTYYFDKTFTTADFTNGTDNFDKIVYTFDLSDKDGRTTSKTFTITLENSGTAFATEITTGNFWHIQGPNAGAYDLDGDATVSSTGDVNTKSMINTDPADATATSSFTGSWNSGNGTEFVKDNSFDYANATIEAATAAYTAGAASGTVTNPAANDVYIAKKGTTYYVIKITAVTPEATKSNNGQITFSYKKN